MFAGHWFFGLRAGSGRACATAADFAACAARARWAEAGAVLVGPVVLVAVAAGFYLAGPAVTRWRHVITGVPVPADTALRREVAALAAAAGLRRPPLIELAKKQEPFVYGAWPPYRLAVPVPSVQNVVNHAPLDLALLAHEIGHARSGDATRHGAVIACWRASLLVVVVPIAVDAWRLLPMAGAAVPQLTWRLLVVAAVLFLAVLSTGRAREFEADARVPAGGPAAGQPAFDRTSALVAAIGSRRYRWWHFAPSPARRLAALADPALRSRPAWHDAAVAGVAAGLLGTELSLLVELAFPANAWPGYLTAALVTAVPAIGALGLPPGLSRWRVAGLGLLFGAGLLAGTQLAPRASADWWRTFPAAGGRAAQLSLLAATPVTAAAIAGAALLLGVAVTGWAAALARHRLVIWLVGVPLLGVPLAAGLLAVRLAAGSGWSPGVLVGLLLTPARQVPLIVVVTAAAAALLLGHRGASSSPGEPSRQPVVRRVPAVAALWVLAVLAIVVHPSLGAAVRTVRASAPRWDSVPPPATTNAAYACFWVNHLGPAGLPGPAEVTGLGRVGAFLSTVDDLPLRRAAASLAGPGGAGTTDRRQAADALDLVLARCDSLLSALDRPLPKRTA
ncbi:hypothetical protein Adu01nite_34060 [Paractinoplanes durhamensis]|uniref:Peptidase M48 domain-containing protein n=2 Tax=Paractinoplanes durhamensis TaxID=113563 RepID=A0ABQ3YWT8_9ACTN|nr:hypothetical protein Adu01nite_34060 [Actinoplanes durhamensis]